MIPFKCPNIHHPALFIIFFFFLLFFTIPSAGTEAAGTKAVGYDQGVVQTSRDIVASSVLVVEGKLVGGGASKSWLELRGCSHGDGAGRSHVA